MFPECSRAKGMEGGGGRERDAIVFSRTENLIFRTNLLNKKRNELNFTELLAKKKQVL